MHHRPLPAMAHQPQQEQHQQQLRRHRLPACHRHPAEPLTGICASCLRERLARYGPATGGGTSTATAGFDFPGAGAEGRGRRDGGLSAPSSPMDLRRSTSPSTGKCEGSVQPRRSSCDARVRRTLCHLFSVDDEKNGIGGEIEVEAGNLGHRAASGAVLESGEEYEDERRARVFVEENDGAGELEEEEGAKTMKEHIDLEWQSMKRDGRHLKDIAGPFWEAASVFSRKLRNWQQRQKTGKSRRAGGDGSGSAAMVGDKTIGASLRDTQSEFGDYGFGRRSCDIDPRLSVDGGRTYLGGPSRQSAEEPRASWDGHLIGRPIPRRTPKPTVVESQAPSVRDGASTEEHSIRVNGMGDPPLPRRWQGRYSNRSGSDRKDPPADVYGESKGANWLNSAVPDDPSPSGGGSESVSGNAATVSMNGGRGRRSGFRAPRRWRDGWNAWTSARRHGDWGCGDEEICCYRRNAADDAMAASPQAAPRGREAERPVNGALTRSRSCVGPRNSSQKAATWQRSSGRQGIRGPRRERVQMPRHSPAHHEIGGLLRFYLTPLRSYRRSASQRRPSASRSVLASLVQLY